MTFGYERNTEDEVCDGREPHETEEEAVPGKIVFVSNQGHEFEVVGRALRAITSVEWDGLTLDVADFVEQLDEYEAARLDYLLRGSWWPDESRRERRQKKTRSIGGGT